MEPQNVIYALHLGDGRYRYVGLTTLGVAERLSMHRKNARQNRLDWPVYRWMRKHGPESVVAEVLEVVATREELDACEMRWIADFRAQGFPLLNCTAGGGGLRALTEELRGRIGPKRGSKLSPEHLEQIRGENNHFYGKKHTPETKAKMSANNGMKRPEVAAKISAIKTGVPRSEETKRRISENKKGVTPNISEEGRRRISERHKGSPKTGAHLRWHVALDKWSENCAVCQFEVAS